MNNNKNTRNNSVWNKLIVLFCLLATVAFGLPSIETSNLQATPGVTLSQAGTSLVVTSPNKSVLTWQNFGSGADTIAVGDSINYTLPSSNSSVLNIVTGGNNTTINGSISSNGNVYILNPNGIIIGSNARIDTNAIYASTADGTTVGSNYFLVNGKLPSQDGLVLGGSSITVKPGATITAVSNNIYLASNGLDLQAGSINGNLTVNATGTVGLSTLGTTFIAGDLTVNNSYGTTTLATPGNTLAVSGVAAINTVAGTVINTAGSSLNARSVIINAGIGEISVAKVVSSNVTAAGKNVSIAYGQNAPVTFAGSATNNISVNAPGALTLSDVSNTGTGTATFVSGDRLSLGKIHLNGTGGASFTGTSIEDAVGNAFVYGATSFTATSGGDVSITKLGNSFGPVSVTTTGNATINESAALNLNVINVGNTLSLSSLGENIFQTSTTGTITNASPVVSAVGSIQLLAPTNTFTTIAANGTDVSLVTANALTLGNVSTNGQLSVTSGGAISQKVGATVKSFSDTTFNTTNNNITLANAGNNFGGLTLNAGNGNISVVESSTIRLLGVGGNTVVLKSGGDIINSGAGAITTRTLNLEAGAGIVLTNATTISTSLLFKAVGAVDLSALSLATNLNSTAPVNNGSGTYTPPTP